MTSNSTLIHRHFSHIYIEKQAQGFPDTDRILQTFSSSQKISIDHYKEVFNRPRQHFQSQKRSMKLILAARKKTFIYEASPYAPSFGLSNFYYNTMILNCLYNCDYCYLQGLYTSGNVVMFVNDEPFFVAADQVLEKKGSLYLCISYDSDLLAFEGIIPLCRRWIQWAEKRSNVLVEIRTKSANFPAIRSITAPKNTILAWTLSPSLIAKNYEKKTPSLQARLRCIHDALNAGWKVRICFDPLLHIPTWKEVYTEFIEEIAECISLDMLYDISIGVFRINKKFLQRIRHQRRDTPILHYPFTSYGKLSSYSETTTKSLVTLILERLRKYTSVTVNVHQNHPDCKQ